MTTSDLKEKLTEDDIRTLITDHMCAEISFEDEMHWISTTVCHHGTSQKLYYYKDSKSFHCYTECGQMDIIGVVIGFKNLEDEERKLSKAIDWICIKLNIDNCEYGFGEDNKKSTLSDWEFIRNIRRHRVKRERNETELIRYSEDVLKLFTSMYYQGWIDEGISIESMKKYSIRYAVWLQCIIIPHYNLENILIGVRVRMMLEEEVEQYGKYMPLRLGKYFFNHPLSQNLFGLNHNIKAIQSKHKIMLVEAEKSVLQTDTMFGQNNFTVALCGNKLSSYQIGVILMLGVREVIVALDKQYVESGTDEYDRWVKHIQKHIITPLSPYMKVSILWDLRNLLSYKDSPTDRGKETLLKLMDDKIYVGTTE